MLTRAREETMAPRAKGWKSLRAVVAVLLAGLGLAACGGRADAHGGSAPGVSGSVIKIGGSFPFSGSFAEFGSASKGLAAYFKKVDAEGGVNGRMIDYTALDDGYDPARGVSNARELIESDNVFALVAFGTPAQAIAPIAAQSKTPQIAVAGLPVFSDINTASFSTTRAWFPNNALEAEEVGKRVVADNPKAKVGLVLLSNDAGTSYGAPVAQAVEAGGGKVVKETLYDPTAATATSQIDQVRAAGANTVVFAAAGAPLIQGIRYIGQLNWHPTITVNESQSGILPTMSNTGRAGYGVQSFLYFKDPDDPQWKDDPAMVTYKADIAKYGSGANPEDSVVLQGYALGMVLTDILKGLGNDITSQKFLAAWDSFPATQFPLLYPQITLHGGEGGRLIHDLQPVVFDGQSWKADGAPVGDGS